MARHVLTFFIIFLGLMLVTRGCMPEADLPPAVPTVTLQRPGENETLVLQDAETDLRVELGRDGTVVSVIQGGVSVLRAVPAWSRPFHLLLVSGDARTRLDDALWSAEELDDGRGYRFTASRDGLRVVKTIRIAAGGRGLDCDLEVEAAGEQASRLWFTTVSGAVLPVSDEENRTGLFWQPSGSKLQYLPTATLVRARQAERATRLRKLRSGDENVPARLTYAQRVELAPGAEVERFGVLSSTHAIEIEGLPEVSELRSDVYRAKRDGETTPELEAWTELIPRDGDYQGDFRLRWTPRDDSEAAQRFADFFETSGVHLLEDDAYRVAFTDRGAAIRGMWLKRFSVEAGQEPSEETWVPILREGVRAGERALTLQGSPDRFGSDPATRVWEVSRPDARSIRFTLTTLKDWRFTKTITLPEKGSYAFDVEVRVEAPGRESETSFVLVGPAGCYIADSYRGIIGADLPAGILLERSGGESDDLNVDKLAEGEELLHQYSGSTSRGLFKAVALRGAYFTCALALDEQRDAEGHLTGPVTSALIKGIELERPIPRLDGNSSAQNMMGRLLLALPLEGGAGTLRARFYAGPNNPDDLRPVSIADTVDYGFFGFIGRGLMWLMKFFHGLIGSWGVAIMLLTFVVRSLLLPVSYKMQLGMQRYQKRITKIKPILDELQKKYANNPQKLNQERMRVMREHKVGFPVGCLMMFVQIPIWFALFQALRVEFALRHQAFLWAPDLSMPDHLFALPFWPHQFNFFPVLMLVLWVAQQKLAPQAGSDDPQVRTQMKMMKFMPYMFFIFLYKYAAALAIYMCVSSAWSIVESKLVRRAIAKMD